MFHQHHGDPGLFDFLDQFAKGVGFNRVQPGSRFVKQKKKGFRSQCPGDLCGFLSACRQVACHFMSIGGKACKFKQFFRPLTGLPLFFFHSRKLGDSGPEACFGAHMHAHHDIFQQGHG